jgi:hypothetical protein
MSATQQVIEVHGLQLIADDPSELHRRQTLANPDSHFKTSSLDATCSAFEC